MLMPIIISRGLDFCEELVSTIDLRVERIPWSNRKIERKFGRRTAGEILASGNTCYMNPCLDLTLTAAAIAQANGVKQKIVIEEHAPSRGFPFNRLHFALNLEEAGEQYHINFKSGNNVIIKNGRYQGRPDLSQIKIVEINGESIDYSLPLHINLGFSSLPRALATMFPEYNAKSHMAKIMKDNTLSRYNLYLRVHGSNFNVNPTKS